MPPALAALRGTGAARPGWLAWTLPRSSTSACLVGLACLRWSVQRNWPPGRDVRLPPAAPRPRCGTRRPRPQPGARAGPHRRARWRRERRRGRVRRAPAGAALRRGAGRPRPCGGSPRSDRAAGGSSARAVTFFSVRPARAGPIPSCRSRRRRRRSSSRARTSRSRARCRSSRSSRTCTAAPNWRARSRTSRCCLPDVPGPPPLGGRALEVQRWQ
jgi:hypothetical protein